MRYQTWVFLVLVFFAEVVIAAAMPNLAVNHSFEKGTSTTADGWTKVWSGYRRVTDAGAWNGSYVLKLQNAKGATTYAGARQRITFNQKTAAPILVTARLKGQDIENLATDKFGAFLYAEIHLVDGSVVYVSGSADPHHQTKNVGTFVWRHVGFNTMNWTTQPIAFIDVVPLLGKVRGIAIFDSLTVQVFPDPGYGAVTFMADDGWDSTYDEMYPILRAAGMVGVTSVIPRYVGQTGYMGLDRLRDLEANGWEIANHTDDHLDLTALPIADMEDQLYQSRNYFRDKGFRVKNIVLPYGYFTGEIMGRSQWYCRSARGTIRGDNPPGTFPFDVRVQEVNSDVPEATWTKWIDQAKARHHWLILLFHEIKDTPGSKSGVYYTTRATLQKIVDKVSRSGLKVLTYDRGLDIYDDAPAETACHTWTLY